MKDYFDNLHAHLLYILYCLHSVKTWIISMTNITATVFKK